MTVETFWTLHQNRIAEAARAFAGEQLDLGDFLQRAIAVETDVLHICSRVVGDREFPDGWREDIQRETLFAIDIHHHLARLSRQPADMLTRTQPVNEKSRRFVIEHRRSVMIERLCITFLQIVAAQVRTCAGRLTSDPRVFLRDREEAMDEDFVLRSQIAQGVKI